MSEFRSETYAPGQARKSNGPAGPDLGEWDAADDVELPPPRPWLLGNVFCRTFISQLIAPGGTGKTALRYAQYLSLATGRALTGEHVFQRCRVLIVSLEDDEQEVRRRILAARLHHGVDLGDVRGQLFLAAPGARAGKLLVLDQKGRATAGTLATTLETVIVHRKIDLVALDPFVKSHGVGENDNMLIDQVAQILSDLAAKHNVAVDIPHHVSKGVADPGNADRGRGASAAKDAARLVYTLAVMTPDEAKKFDIPEGERRRYIRVDGAKVNLAPPTADAQWFRLVGVSLGNATKTYPSGDTVQTVEPWRTSGIWDGLSNVTLNVILDAIDAGPLDEDGRPTGERYSNAPAAQDRAVWPVVQRFAPGKAEAACRRIINAWLDTGVLVDKPYVSPARRRQVSGLCVNTAKRPGTEVEG